MSILNLFQLDNQVAIVTGAGRGIGQAIAVGFAEAGADVVIGARTLSELEQTAEAVKKAGRRAVIVKTDILKAEDRKALIDAAINEFGRLDILVNNAGGWPPKPALHTSPEEFENAISFNVTSALAMTQLAVPHMLKTIENNNTSSGSVLNISSIAGTEPSACFAAYGTAKSALSFLSKELAQDFAPKIRVNAINVGSTKTSALNTVLNDEIEAAMVDLTPMARLGEVEDIAAAALYLSSPAACYVTGEILGVHGGLTGLNMRMPRAFD